MKAITGYEGRYSVTKCGMVYSHITNRFKKNTLRNDGYLATTLIDSEGGKKTFLVHRIVATAFLSVEKGKDCVNHLDRNKSNNRLENLEWCTYSENNAHYLDNYKEPNSYNSYDEETVVKIIKYIMDGWRRVDIAESMGLTLNQVKYILGSDHYEHYKEDFDWDNRPTKRQSLSDEKVLHICKLLENGETSYNKIIQEVGGINKAHIYTIKKRKTYKYLSESFNF